ncbi:FAD-linked oxidase [Sphaerisporangium rufum]|uniref:FAD-linked oxidase n=1 Tax=Sphaerisporangium rufum TaxID=1381558 RepID=A0A919QY29_9ACTN|nr:FAD-binding protein [Sphaerisporangium rufum]GII76221.1 FAD-linked oxidase [Sphaerisporangium rufum]
MTEVQGRGHSNGSGTAEVAGRAATAFGPSTITRDDPRYDSMLRGTNHRHVGSPDYIRVVTTTAQVVDAVNEAVAAGRPIAVRSGGHGLENFVADPRVKVLLDMSEMTAVYYDERRHAFAIEPGATLGHVYRVLFKGWGVTLPGGMCPEVGAGGHFAGGGYGPLSRSHGAVVDYLYAVEVVCVGADGTAQAIIATREPGDPHHDLWWAHTGGGGGNFGVVTRYWMRAPGTPAADPAALLPKAPAATRSGMAIWSWDGMPEEGFTTLLRNFGTWCENNSAAGTPQARLFPYFHGTHRSTPPGLMVGALVDEGTPDAEALMDAFLDEVSAGVPAAPQARFHEVQPWLYAASYPGYGDPGNPGVRRFKLKAAYMRKGYTDRQIAAIHRHLTGEVYNPTQLLLVGYGGQVNTVPSDATATAQRDSILKAAYLGAWGSPADDDTNIGLIRELYRDVYADSGGVPGPDERSDGAYINYPDADLADPELNTSGVPWHTLYYKDNYPRLQRVKKRYDPRDTFRHALSVRLPD